MRTLLLIPKQVGAVVNIASEDETRPFITGVHVKQESDGSAIIEATDGGSLVRVILSEDESRNPADFPVVRGLDPALSGQAEAIIPPDAWKAAFGAAKKNGRTKVYMPILHNVAHNVALTMHEGQAILAVTDLASSTVIPARTIEGSYPNTNAVIPQEDGTPKATVWFDARRLRELLQIMEGLVEQGSHAVRLEVYNHLQVIAIRGRNVDESLEVVGLVMPLRMYDDDGTRHWPQEKKTSA